MNETDTIQNFVNLAPSNNNNLWNLSFLIIGALLGFFSQYLIELFKNRKHLKEQKTSLFTDLMETIVDIAYLYISCCLSFYNIKG